VTDRAGGGSVGTAKRAGPYGRTKSSGSSVVASRAALSRVTLSEPGRCLFVGKVGFAPAVSIRVRDDA
jgi:hypothetical protein